MTLAPIATVLDIIFPRRCVGCSCYKTFLCDSCKLKLRRELHVPDAKTVAYFSYHDPIIKNALWHLKYKGKYELGKVLGELLYDEAWEGLAERRQFNNFLSPIIVTVPVSKKRKRQRGYNHALLIARGFANQTHGECPIVENILEKYRDTKRQAEIKVRKERLSNLKDSFRVTNPSLIKGKNVLLIDDVTTTGATFDEATRALKKSGARSVVRLALAH